MLMASYSMWAVWYTLESVHEAKARPAAGTIEAGFADAGHEERTGEPPPRVSRAVGEFHAQAHIARPRSLGLVFRCPRVAVIRQPSLAADTCASRVNLETRLLATHPVGVEGMCRKSAANV